ncbi:MAG: fumarylacetoacetate hydrolase family protein [Pseudomonadota bacterium]
MKLASLKHGRDGRLLVVSRDLARAVEATKIAPTLQAALDGWATAAPALQALSDALNAGTVESAPFDPSACAAPLPRAFQWADGSAYVNHVELVRRARGADIPQRFWHEPLLYQGGSDDLLGPRDDIPLGNEDWGLDFESELAVITDDVPAGTSADAAAEHVQLLMLVNDVSLRGLIPGELEKGFGFFQSKPATAFSPVAITPDELGTAWQDARVCLPLITHYNRTLFGRPDAGQDMTFSFADLIAHATRTRNLGAGTIIGSGTVSNKARGAKTADDDYGAAISEGGTGYSCLAELRMVETLRTGAPITGFLRAGDHVQIDMFDLQGASIFGAIEQRVVPASGSPAQ